MQAMLLDDSTPCGGHATAPICDACTRLQAPADYAGSVPVVSLLVPGARLVDQPFWQPPEWFCADRRSTGTHRPAAVLAGAAVAVGAGPYCVHQRTLGGGCHQVKPLSHGG